MIKHLFSFLFFFLIYLSSFCQYTIQSAPNPKQNGQDYFVSNPDNILDDYTVDSLNKICIAIEKETSAEVTVVVINDFEGGSDFDFALNLFNHWGIGKKENNSGLLLFVAKDKRVYQFITGRGMEGTLTDVMLGAVSETYLVPKFKEGDYAGGVLDAINTIKNLLLDPETAKELKAEIEANSFWNRNKSDIITSLAVLVVFFIIYFLMRSIVKKMKLKPKRYATLVAAGAFLFILFIPSIFILASLGIHPKILFSFHALPWFFALFGITALLFKYAEGVTAITHGYRDKETIVNKLSEYNKQMTLFMLLSPISFFYLIGLNKRKNELELRLLPPDESGNWKRLNRDRISKIGTYLDKGQRREERLRTISYEIWQNTNDDSFKLIKWNGKNFKKYEDCPKCKWRTLNKVSVRTVKAATYSSTGVGEKMQDCESCDYEQTLGTVILSKLVRSSSSSGGSGGSSSSSSGGSFGGGSSGGGGAGGSW